MQKYKAYIGYSMRIELVECERETDKCVWVEGRKFNKRSSYENFFDTFDEAKNCCLQNCEAAVATARCRLDAANSKLNNVKGIKHP